jgi:solute carrier family 25 (mitochondrial aspartate/glutamate transporter), member 12/13
MSSRANSANANKSKEKKIPMGMKLVVGGIAGIIGTCCIYPIDMVKTRLQQDSTGIYRSPLHCARTLLKSEGAGGFYKGLGPNLVGVTPEKAIKLAVNEAMRERLENSDGSIGLFSEIIAGATAGFCQVIATNPMEIVKIRMQTMAFKPVEERMSTMQVIRHLGLRGLYRGTPATLLRDVPFSFIIFPGYVFANVLLSLLLMIVFYCSSLQPYIILIRYYHPIPHFLI